MPFNQSDIEPIYLRNDHNKKRLMPIKEEMKETRVDKWTFESFFGIKSKGQSQIITDESMNRLISFHL
ncbi:hypothetical protein BCV72DRAFT_225590 [Rhizopus microsporus var. microsporus]|uniref:Uncharacterized protein n=2 Tax=Rhizopus microsporus TaxID=58291 RepID=A0A2G4ST86_RHIZD|nr:uncharacterized protein RHIMIDRAFT_283718 [Rhizopus microsporus ATCC 52813]ORE08106.1 hypothetical protein BCV72DRAFT_225590 [Rhizopus microsporus var. microsporus]PHZ11970.1 hypothetical protein RHIMIDRAFT_283718 [Rhizopus microsporus ATCC 52813]